VNDPHDVPTVRLAHVLGASGRQLPDPTEDFHEASRIYPGVVDPFVQGAARLERSPEMRVSASRSVKRHRHLPFLALPRPDLGATTLAHALVARRSRRTYGTGSISVEAAGALLHAAYGVTGNVASTTQALRAAPSGGALYPLELYIACQRVEGTEAALYHYDPLRHGLELLRPLAAQELAPLTPYRELLEPSAAVILVTAMFWRSRFKYGARAYRFTLMEAGHAGQNLVLAATALGLATVPLGGFYDRLVDGFLGIDGLYEAALYLFPIGRTES